MWRVGMWYGDEKTTANSYLRSGAIAFGAFVVTGIIFITLQQSMDAVNKRLTGAYGKANGDENGTAPTFAPNTTPINAQPSQAFTPSAAPMPINNYYASPRTSLPPTPTGSSPVEPPRPNIPAAFTVFTNDGERLKAKMALADLHVVVQDFHNYNSDGLQKSLSGSDSSNQKIASFDGDAGSVENSQASDTAKQRIVVDRVSSEVEGLSAGLSLTAHPDRFPEAIQDQVGQVSRELRTYLQDVRYAAAMPSERSRLLSAAAQHLSQADTALQGMDQIVGSGTNRNFP